MQWRVTTTTATCSQTRSRRCVRLGPSAWVVRSAWHGVGRQPQLASRMLPVGPPLAGLHHVEPDRQVEHRHADQRVRGVARHCRGLVGGASGNTCLSCAACLSHPAWLQYPIRHGTAADLREAKARRWPQLAATLGVAAQQQSLRARGRCPQRSAWLGRGGSWPGAWLGRGGSWPGQRWADAICSPQRVDWLRDLHTPPACLASCVSLPRQCGRVLACRTRCVSTQSGPCEYSECPLCEYSEWPV